MAQQPGIDRFASIFAIATGMDIATGAGGLPQFLGDAMHVNRKADAAIADKRDAKFLLAHTTPDGRGAARAPVRIVACHTVDRNCRSRQNRRMAPSAGVSTKV